MFSFQLDIISFGKPYPTARNITNIWQYVRRVQRVHIHIFNTLFYRRNFSRRENFFLQ